MSFLEKFETVTVMADNRITEADRAFCEAHQEAYESARRAIQELRCIWADIEATQKELRSDADAMLPGSFSYVTEYEALSISDTKIKDQLLLLPCRFISNLTRYFNRTYHISISVDQIQRALLPEKPESRRFREGDEEAAEYEAALLTVKLSYSTILEQILAQMDGRSFEEQAFHELRKKCHEAAWWNSGGPKFERRKDTITFSDYACSFVDSYRAEHWELRDFIKTILQGIAHYETGDFSILPMGFSELLGYRITHGPVLDFPTCTKLKQIKLFKKGRIDLKFSSEQAAVDFITTYLGAVY